MLKLYTALLLSLFTPKTQVLTAKQVSNVLETSVIVRVKQYTVDEDKQIRRGVAGCSGTYISEDEILTAGHCFMYNVTDIWVRGEDGVSLKGSLLKLDHSVDLALLRVEDLDEGHAFAKLAKRARVGEQVITVGTPFSIEFMVNEGTVARLNYKEKMFTGHYLIHSAMINPGSSGGGAFNSKGELLGVNTMSIGGPFGFNGITLAVDGETIRRFLQ